METVKKILEFQGKYRFLSNFWKCRFVWDNILWRASENAYVAAKTTDREFRLEISAIETPGEVKRFGRKMLVRPDWEEVKVGLMEEIVRAKFQQNGDLAHLLLETGDAILEEGNRWGDRVWGVSPAGSGNGRNELGKILMKVRDDLKGQRIVLSSPLVPTHCTEEDIIRAVRGLVE
jgi:ribA/ribD-fused uncharacterized protein